jgi:glutathione S-transferase
MAGTEIELHQFRYSHFNEKARWALDFKEIAHTRVTYLPGPHMAKIRKLTGQTATPVVRIGDRYVHGSARIIEELEGLFPDPPLYPRDPALKARALEIQDRFDRDIGPRARRAILGTMMEGGSYIPNMFSEKKSGLKRGLYRATFPLAKSLIRKGNGITGPDSIADGIAAIREGLDYVARESGASGYLVGDAFSVADLAAASLLSPAIDPPDSEMTRPRPMHRATEALLAQFADHPGRTWVLEMYRHHRGRSSELDAASMSAASATG